MTADRVQHRINTEIMKEYWNPLRKRINSSTSARRAFLATEKKKRIIRRNNYKKKIKPQTPKSGHGEAQHFDLLKNFLM